MARRRLLYGALLLGALGFQIYNTVYLAHFVLLLVVSLPVLSLLVSLPAMLHLRVVAKGRDVLRGEMAQFRLTLESPSAFPVGWLKFRLILTHSKTGQSKVAAIRVRGVTNGLHILANVDTTHCGQIVCSSQRAKVCDALGLFCLSRPILPGSMLILPRPGATELLAQSAPCQQPEPVPCPKAGRRGEEYELRPYRPGDPMRQVHWKLSAKQWDEELVVREMQEDRIPTVVILFDLNGPPAALDQRLDRLDSLCGTLLAEERTFYVTWCQGESYVSKPVENSSQLHALYTTLLSLPVTKSPGSFPKDFRPAGLTGPLHHHKISHAEESPS